MLINIFRCCLQKHRNDNHLLRNTCFQLFFEKKKIRSACVSLTESSNSHQKCSERMMRQRNVFISTFLRLHFATIVIINNFTQNPFGFTYMRKYSVHHVRLCATSTRSLVCSTKTKGRVRCGIRTAGIWSALTEIRNGIFRPFIEPNYNSNNVLHLTLTPFLFFF